MTTEQQEMCRVLIDHADTKKEVVDAMSVIPKIQKSGLMLFIHREWRARKLDGRKISLVKRSYNEIAEILIDLTDRLIAKEIKQVELTINKAKAKSISNSMYEALCINSHDVDIVRGKKLNLIDFDRVRMILEDPSSGRVYQLLIWDINKLRFINVK